MPMRLLSGFFLKISISYKVGNSKNWRFFRKGKNGIRKFPIFLHLRSSHSSLIVQTGRGVSFGHSSKKNKKSRKKGKNLWNTNEPLRILLVDYEQTMTKGEKMKKIILINPALLLAASAPAPVATRLVPSEYPTIQAGVAAAGDGDIVMVMEGTYFENISFGGKNFDVLSLKVSDRQ